MKSLAQRLGIIGILLAIVSSCLGKIEQKLNEEQAEIISLLSEIDESLVYWKIHKNSPKRYLLSQGPRAWLAQWRGTNTITDQIACSIKILGTKQKELFARLGSLQKNSTQQQTSFSINAIRSSIAPHLKPSHIQRNAFSYLLTGAGAVAVGIAAYRSSDRLHALSKNLLYVWKTSNTQQDRVVPVNTKAVRDNLYNRFVCYAGAMRQGFIDKIDGLMISEERKAFLKQSIESGDGVKAAELMAELDKELRSNFSASRSAQRSFFGVNGLKNDMYNAAQAVVLSNFDISFLFIADQLRDYMKWMLYDVWNPLESSQQYLCNEMEHFRNRLQSLAWQIPCAVAAIGFGIGMKKIINSRKRDNFQLLRTTLGDLEAVVNDTDESVFNNEDMKKGKLTYLYHTLRMQIKKFLPNNEIRVKIEGRLEHFEMKPSEKQKNIIKELRDIYPCFHV